MKNAVLLTLAVFSCFGFEGLSFGQAPTGSKVRAQLVDGSQIFGITPSESIKLKLEFSELSIPLAKVRRIEWKPKSAIARVELLNDDVISGELIADSIAVQALFGVVELRCEHLRSIDRLPPQSAGSMPIRKGLVAYYSFDHGQEALGADDAAEKYRAEVKGAKWIKEGRLGGGVQFDGNSSLTIGHDDGLNFTKGITLSTWLNPGEGERYGYAMIVGKTTGSSWHGGFGLARMSGDAENLHFFVNNYSSSVVKAPVKAGQWSHVVGVFDGKVIKIYVNGKEIESLPASRHAKVRDLAHSVDASIQPVSAPLMLGSDPSGYFWKGKLDETALFDRALSAEEITRLYETGASEIAAK